LFLVLVVAAMITEIIDRNFGRASIWCLIAAAFSWVGLMHSAILRWGAQPSYAAGWLAAAAIVFSGRWWRGDVVPASTFPVSEQHSATEHAKHVGNTGALLGVHSKIEA
jgi:disulfide bond formation protein DsbB